MNANKGDCRPKNNEDQIMLRNNCMLKIDNAILTPFFFIPCFQIINNEKPINKYNKVQTGPKTQFGGLKLGLIKVVYHVETEFAVNIEPINPANNGIAKETINLLNFIRYFLSFCFMLLITYHLFDNFIPINSITLINITLF